MSRPIGSVLPLAIGDLPPLGGESILGHWRSDGIVTMAYRSARAALTALLAALRPRRVWIPAYICPEVLAAAATAGPVEFFPVGEDLEPDIDRLEKNLEEGDAVLAIDYFGRQPAPAWRQFVTQRRDVHWIEDRAQALDPGEPWGDFLVYSPRKLVGIPDGGILVLRQRLDGMSEPVGKSGLATSPAVLQRLENVEPDHDMPAWFSAFRHEEGLFDLQPQAMSQLGTLLLDRLPMAPLRKRRCANAKVLQQALPELSFYSASFDAPPLGFPIRVPDASALAARLAEKRIWCARHWARLASPIDRFPVAQALSAQLLTLPCDQRYDEADMMRLATAVKAAVQPR